MSAPTAAAAASDGSVDLVKLRIGGMDCGACALKIETALKRLPGASDVRVNFATETLILRLDLHRTSRQMLEGKIRALGYTPDNLGGSLSAAGDETRPRTTERSARWRTTRKAGMVLVTAG